MATRKKTEDPWPLGTYLRQQRGRMSIREAARRADISESRWRQVEAGVQKMPGGVNVPVHPRPETVAAMCNAVTADPTRGLELAGYDPAHYPWLTEATQELAEESMEWFSHLPREERERVLSELQRLHVDVELGKKGGRASRRIG